MQDNPTIYTVDSDKLRSSKPLSKVYNKELPKQPQKLVMINVAHVYRNPFSSKPCFRILHFGNSVEECGARASREIDAAVVETQKPFVCSEHTTIADEVRDAHISTAREKVKSKLDKEVDQVTKRAEVARAISTKNQIENIIKQGGTNEKEIPEIPELPQLSAVLPPEDRAPPEPEEQGEPAPKSAAEMSYHAQAERAVGQNYAVISVLNPEDREPVIIFYAAFAEIEAAEAYCTNVIGPSAEADLNIVAIGTWYRCDVFKVFLSEQTQYLNSGLNEMMQIPQRNSKLKEKYKPYIEELERLEEGSLERSES